MSERDAPRVYGVRIGLIAGLFAIAQVLLSVAAARGSEASLRAIQRAFSILTSGGIADPTTVAPALLPMLLTTYLAMLAVGLLTVWFASRAGRLAAIAQGRRARGATAGMWVWLTCTGIWLLASIIATVITNSDGTLSGAFVGTFSSAFLPQELIFLLAQEIVAALVCLGFCALAGAQGARNAPVQPPADAALQPLRGPMGYPPPGAYPTYPTYPAYPAPYPYAPYPAPGAPVYQPQPGQQPYPGYPPYPAYPPAGWGGAPQNPPAQQPPQSPQTSPAPTSAPPAPSSLVYPPPPSFYVPEKSSSAAPQPEQG